MNNKNSKPIQKIKIDLQWINELETAMQLNIKKSFINISFHHYESISLLIIHKFSLIRYGVQKVVLLIWSLFSKFIIKIMWNFARSFQIRSEGFKISKKSDMKSMLPWFQSSLSWPYRMLTWGKRREWHYYGICARVCAWQHS